MHHPPPAEAPGTSGVLQQLTLASFGTQASIQALATDPFGNVYAAGATAGSSFSPAPVHAFLAKVTADGAIVWTTHLGGSNQDQLAAIAADYQGNLYVTGTTHSPDFPTTLPSIGAPGQQAVFVTKYSTGGTLLWSVRIGGSVANSASALAVDSTGSVYVTGGLQRFSGHARRIGREPRRRSLRRFSDQAQP